MSDAAPTTAMTGSVSTGHAAYVHSARKGSFLKRPDKLGGPLAWIIWIVLLVAVCWQFALQTGYAVVSQNIQAAGHMTTAQIALAGAVYTWVYGVFQFLSGALIDRFSLRPLMWITMVLVTLGAFLYAFSVNIGILIGAQFLMAAGSAFGFVGAGYAGGKWFRATLYGLLFGIVQAGTAVTSAILQPAVSWMLGDHITFRSLLIGFGVVGIVLTIGVLIFVRDPRIQGVVSAPKESAGKALGGTFVDLGKTIWNRDVILCSVMSGATFGVLLAVGSLWGPRMMQARGFSTGFSTLLTALSWVGLAVGSILIPWFSTKTNRWKWPTVVGTALTLVFTCLLIYIPHYSEWLGAVFMFFVGFFASVEMLGMSIAAVAVRPALLGASAAVVNGFEYVFGGVLEVIPGRFIPAKDITVHDWMNALWCMPAILAVALVASFFLRSDKKNAEIAASYLDLPPGGAPAKTGAAGGGAPRHGTGGAGTSESSADSGAPVQIATTTDTNKGGEGQIKPLS